MIRPHHRAHRRCTSRRSVILVSALALVAGPAILACGGAEEAPAPQTRAAEEPPEKPVSPALTITRTVNPTHPAYGKRPVMGKDLPDGFPEDIPQHPEGHVVESRVAADGGMTVSLAVEGGDLEEVTTFYADAFAAEGWATDIRRTKTGHVIFADKGGRVASVMVRSSDDGALVDLAIIRMQSPAGS